MRESLKIGFFVCLGLATLWCLLAGAAWAIWGTNVQGRILSASSSNEDYLITYRFHWRGIEQHGFADIDLGSAPEAFFATLPAELFRPGFPRYDDPPVHVPVTVRVHKWRGGLRHDVLPRDIAPWRRHIVIWTFCAFWCSGLAVALYRHAVALGREPVTAGSAGAT